LQEARGFLLGKALGPAFRAAHGERIVPLGIGSGRAGETGDGAGGRTAPWGRVTDGPMGEG
jgi:hypothetical protein